MIKKARDYVDENGDSNAANRVDKQKAPIVRRATSARGLRKYLSKDRHLRRYIAFRSMRKAVLAA